MLFLYCEINISVQYLSKSRFNSAFDTFWSTYHIKQSFFFCFR